MGAAKDIEIKIINNSAANSIVRRYHYSGKVTPNSQLNYGVLMDGRLLGALQYGPPIDRRRAAMLFEGAGIRQMLELNRMAFSDLLPRNSESRAISWTLKNIKKLYPDIIWVQSFSDACACGDGTIYRAAGLDLVQIKRNTTQLVMPDGTITAKKTLDNDPNNTAAKAIKNGAKPQEGHQIKYIKVLHPEWWDKFTGQKLPYSEIEKAGAKMYKGKRVDSIGGNATDLQSGDSGSTPTSTLQSTAVS